MLKLKLTADQFTTCDDSIKKEYLLQSDGSYSLDLGPEVFTTDKDPAGLFSALQKTREELKTVKAVADAFEKDKAKVTADGISSMEELKTHFQKQLDDRDKASAKAEKNRKEEAIALTQASAEQSSRSKALEIASKLFGTNAALMLPHVAANLKGKVGQEGQALIEIIDPSTGLPSLDQNFDNFEKTLSTNELYKSMIVVSNASGGSANGDTSGNLATVNSDGTAKKYSDFNSGELVRMKNEQPDTFKSLLESR